MKYETLVPSAQWLVSAAAAATASASRSFSSSGAGASRRSATQPYPVFAALIFLLGFHGKELDINYSARPSPARSSIRLPASSPSPSGVKRDMDYGLAFYRNQP